WLEGSCATAGTCSNMPLAIEAITHFDDANGSDPLRLMTTPTHGGVTFADPSGADQPLVDIAVGPNGTKALRVTGARGSPVPFDAGLRFDLPLDARNY